MAQSSFRSMDVLSDAWTQMEVRSGDIARTEIEIVSHSHGTGRVDVTIRNTGKILLRDFEQWDVIMQYYESNGTYHQVWLPYTASYPPGNNQWAVKGIYIDANGTSSEVFQPDILDPTEYVVIRIIVSPAYKNDGQNRVTIGTPNGVTVSSMV